MRSQPMREKDRKREMSSGGHKIKLGEEVLQMSWVKYKIKRRQNVYEVEGE